MDREYFAEAGPEDGADPRRYLDRRTPRNGQRGAGRKAWQLCAQVADALRQILAGSADDRLHGVEVIGVEPAPNSGHLRVWYRGGDAPVLAAARAYLRAEVATRIHRRHAPELVFAAG